MENISQANKRSTLGQFVYRQRAVVGNVIVFWGFLVIWFDPYAGITIARLLSGLTVGVLGFALRIWASSYQWPNIARPLPDARSGLITAGPYSLMRHPIYLSMLLLTVGIFLAFGSWLAALLVVPPTVVLNYWQARFEDAFLLERYGPQALEYKKQMPLFLPKFWNPYPIRNGSFSLRQGLKFDIGPLSAFVCFGLAMLFVVLRQAPTFTITLIVLVGSVAFSFFLTWLVRSIFKQEFAE